MNIYIYILRVLAPLLWIYGYQNVLEHKDLIYQGEHM